MGSNNSNHQLIVNGVSPPIPARIHRHPQPTSSTISSISETTQELPGFSFEYISSCEFITETACCICFEPYYPGMTMQMIPCNHVYHKSCLQEWYQKNPLCPLCRHRS